MRYRITAGRHVGEASTISRALHLLTLAIIKGGSEEEQLDLQNNLMLLQDNAAEMEEDWDVSSGTPERRQ